MPQYMWGDTFAQIAVHHRLADGLAHRCGADVTTKLSTRKQVASTRPVRDPVRAKSFQQALAEHDVTVLIAFSQTDVDDHACTVDVVDAKRNSFFDSQPASVGHGRDHSVPEWMDGLHELADFAGAQNIG